MQYIKVITSALGERGDFPESAGGEPACLFPGDSVRVAKVLIFGYCRHLLARRRHPLWSRKNSQIFGANLKWSFAFQQTFGVG